MTRHIRTSQATRRSTPSRPGAGARATRPRTDPVGWRGVLSGDRGSVSAELVLATPLLLLLLLAIVQFATWSHATHIAQAAASQGLSVLRSQSGTPTGCAAAARALLDQLARGPLTGADVDCVRDAATGTVRVDGAASPVIPLVDLPVRGDATGPVERFVPDLPTG